MRKQTGSGLTSVYGNASRAASNAPKKFHDQPLVRRKHDDDEGVVVYPQRVPVCDEGEMGSAQVGRAEVIM